MKWEIVFNGLMDLREKHRNEIDGLNALLEMVDILIESLPSRKIGITYKFTTQTERTTKVLETLENIQRGILKMILECK